MVFDIHMQVVTIHMQEIWVKFSKMLTNYSCNSVYHVHAMGSFDDFSVDTGGSTH